MVRSTACIPKTEPVVNFRNDEILDFESLCAKMVFLTGAKPRVLVFCDRLVKINHKGRHHG